MNTLLVVEDDFTLAMELASVFTTLGFAVHCEARGKKAIEAATSMTVDAAIIDINLPDMSGRDVVSALRRDRPDLPILIYTGYCLANLKWATNERIPIFQKPVDESLLVMAMRRQLNRGNDTLM